MHVNDDYQQFAAIREVRFEGVVVHVFGDVDCWTAPKFESALDEATLAEETRNGTVTLNLTRTRYLDSSGLSVLVRAHRRLGLRLHVLVRPKSFISRILNITSFDRLFSVATELRPLHDPLPAVAHTR